MNRIKAFITDFGWPRIIIAIFLLALFISAPFVGVKLDASFTDVFNRFGQNVIMVLALVPMVQAGCGLNFGLPLGILSGLLGSTMAMQFGLTGPMGFLVAILITIFFGSIFGLGYGKLLNKVKGEEMTIAMYVGFSAVMLFSILWLLLPYTKPDLVMGYAGEGLRRSISLEKYWDKILNNFLALRIGSVRNLAGNLSGGFIFPTGLMMFVAACVVFMWFFLRTKTGTAMTAVGSNPDFARASGVSVEKMRTTSVVVSTIIGGIGILVYQQSFGFVQVYDAPLYMAFPAVSALLIGGASVTKASMLNVVIGTLLFQGMLTMTPSVINSVLKTDMSEVIRIIVSNGMIIYALTRKTKVTK
ncbi:MAG: ABC transporter [Spirochaetes bacterium GWD1_61_31]|nr:MAG: ABC transporter [Spirochaetes bacterium GWB1_60_80]OHD34105.1 MAG: ABC transporter [Spirochaetes bacterium GWC1_61_12]OHD35405.1 MAG: ABC transporter [Spirochaetes bacterium GWD1_61_31]OHD44913.1 MAG: ABC transporter [Spirochaetes bacterium GWE1_60_18]OHD60024.1 MAG: ABC transporter [Spirochaetes bacterium GWF1_60_12]HAP43708.1 ABC transporter [Spirochaetaceae bacterium]